MASDNEASCVSDPNFAVICSFLECFGKFCGITYPDIGKLQEMLDNNHEVSQELIDLHIKLLRKTRKSVASEKWEKALVKFCHTYSNQDGWEIERFGYKKVRVAVKLRLLKVLLETQFDLNQKFKNEVNNISSNELRLEPLGRDKTGQAYWFQLDENCNIRVYREDLDEESWELVAKDREGVVKLIATLSEGETGQILSNEDSNSLEISEKPITDTGQVSTSSPSLDDESIQENVEATTAVPSQSVTNSTQQPELLTDSTIQHVKISTEKSADSDEEVEEDEYEEPFEEEDEDDDVDDDDETSQEVIPEAKLNLFKTSRNYTELEQKPEPLLQRLPAKLKSTEFEAPKYQEDFKETLKLSVIKAIETPVITTSPLKMIPPTEYKPPIDNRIPDTPQLLQAIKQSESLEKPKHLPFASVEVLNQPKLLKKPINEVAANLVRLQSEKLASEKPGVSKLEKIAENLARSGGIHTTMVNGGEEEKLAQDFTARSRGIDLSTSPRGWETSTEHIRAPVALSGMDLSSRKPQKMTYRTDFQAREMDLSTKKSKPEMPSMPYDARNTMLRNHAMIADLSKRQMPFAGYEMQPGSYHAQRLPGKEDHRLPGYSILPDPSKLTSMRLGKRVLEGEDQQDMMKRFRSDVMPIHGSGIDRKPGLNPALRRDEVGPAIQEPLMIIQGEGSGSDCDAGRIIYDIEDDDAVGEAIDEPVRFFYGEGSGAECDTGNPGDDTSNDNKDANESKAESCSDVSQTKIDDVGTLRTLVNDCDDDKVHCPVGGSGESPKAKFKPTLGVQVFNKSPSGSAKRLSRWDVREPDEKRECDSSIISSGENISNDNLENNANDLSDKRDDLDEAEAKSEENISSTTPKKQVASLIKSENGGESTNTDDSEVSSAIEAHEPESSNENACKSPQNHQAQEDEQPRFFFGPNCISYTSEATMKSNDSTEKPAESSKETSNPSVANSDLKLLESSANAFESQFTSHEADSGQPSESSATVSCNIKSTIVESDESSNNEVESSSTDNVEITPSTTTINSSLPGGSTIVPEVSSKSEEISELSGSNIPTTETSEDVVTNSGESEDNNVGTSEIAVESPESCSTFDKKFEEISSNASPTTENQCELDTNEESLAEVSLDVRDRIEKHEATSSTKESIFKSSEVTENVIDSTENICQPDSIADEPADVSESLPIEPEEVTDTHETSKTPAPVDSNVDFQKDDDTDDDGRNSPDQDSNEPMVIDDGALISNEFKEMTDEIVDHENVQSSSEKSDQMLTDVSHEKTGNTCEKSPSSPENKVESSTSDFESKKEPEDCSSSKQKDLFQADLLPDESNCSISKEEEQELDEALENIEPDTFPEDTTENVDETAEKLAVNVISPEKKEGTADIELVSQSINETTSESAAERQIDEKHEETAQTENKLDESRENDSKIVQVETDDSINQEEIANPLNSDISQTVDDQNVETPAVSTSHLVIAEGGEPLPPEFDAVTREKPSLVSQASLVANYGSDESNEPGSDDVFESEVDSPELEKLEESEKSRESLASLEVTDPSSNEDKFYETSSSVSSDMKASEASETIPEKINSTAQCSFESDESSEMPQSTSTELQNTPEITSEFHPVDEKADTLQTPTASTCPTESSIVSEELKPTPEISSEEVQKSEEIQEISSPDKHQEAEINEEEILPEKHEEPEAITVEIPPEEVDKPEEIKEEIPPDKQEQSDKIKEEIPPNKPEEMSKINEEISPDKSEHSDEIKEEIPVEEPEKSDVIEAEIQPAELKASEEVKREIISEELKEPEKEEPIAESSVESPVEVQSVESSEDMFDSSKPETPIEIDNQDIEKIAATLNEDDDEDDEVCLEVSSRGTLSMLTGPQQVPLDITKTAEVPLQAVMVNETEIKENTSNIQDVKQVTERIFKETKEDISGNPPFAIVESSEVSAEKPLSMEENKLEIPMLIETPSEIPQPVIINEIKPVEPIGTDSSIEKAVGGQIPDKSDGSLASEEPSIEKPRSVFEWERRSVEKPILPGKIDEDRLELVSENERESDEDSSPIIHISKRPRTELQDLTIVPLKTELINLQKSSVFDNPANFQSKVEKSILENQLDSRIKPIYEEMKPVVALSESKHENRPESNMKQDLKKEANKRLYAELDSEDIPPLKSRPSGRDFMNEEPLANDVKLLDQKSQEILAQPSNFPLQKNELEVKTKGSLFSNNLESKVMITESSEDLFKASDPLKPEVVSISTKMSEDSEDSMGIDNDCMYEPPIEEPSEINQDNLSKVPEISASAGLDLGVKVKEVNELHYDNWKLDSAEPMVVQQKLSRKRRNSTHESNSEDCAKLDDADDENMGGKRMKLRGKRTPDTKLRRSIEESRIEDASSDEEEAAAPLPEPIPEVNEKMTIEEAAQAPQPNIPKPRGKVKGRRRRAVKSKRRSLPTKKQETTLTTNETSMVIEEVKKDEAISTPIVQKKRKKRKMVLGLEIGIDIVENDTQQQNQEPPVRQSRRIAQIKIKEEADRRRIEEETLENLKVKNKRDNSDKKKRKKHKDSDEEVRIKEIDRSLKEAREDKSKKKRKKRKKKEAKFNEAKPWQSSSGSSSDTEENEEEEEEEEIESEGSLLFKSDHEFSPESDLEKDAELEPMRRARTAQKSDERVEDAEDEYACQKCGKVDHPEWILLCDTCDKGWHCSCLRPALMLIPEGDWFCPPCQHNLLINKLRESLKMYDQNLKKHENEILRKKRLAYVGISLDNVLPKSDIGRKTLSRDVDDESDESDGDGDESKSKTSVSVVGSGSDESSSSSSGTALSSSSQSSSDESEPVYQLRERRCVNTSYKFNEYDDMINAAIQDEVEAVQGAGNQGRGKDISTIVNAKKEEAEINRFEKVSENIEEEADKQSDKGSDKDYAMEKDADYDDEEEDESRKKTSHRKILGKKKHRKLNSLDISSEDDPESDEDFKGTSSDEEEDYEDQLVSTDESFTETRRRGKRGDYRPIRRSTRAARRQRYDQDFINDESEDSDRPKRKKSRSTWEESESEESDNSWRQRSKKSKMASFARLRAAAVASKNKGKKKKKRKRIIQMDSDNGSDNEETKPEAAVVPPAPPTEIAPEEDDDEEEEEEGAPVETAAVEVPQLKESLQLPESSVELAVRADEGKTMTPEPVASYPENLSQNLPQPSIEVLRQTPELPSQIGESVIQVLQPPLVVDESDRKREKKKREKGIRRKIIYGGLPEDRPLDDDEPLGRRTRGRKINYQVDAMMSDSEEELKKALRKTEDSEEEFVVNDGEGPKVEPDKDSDSADDEYSPQKNAAGKHKSLKNRRSKKSPASRKSTDNGEPKQRKKPGPKPGSKNKPRTPRNSGGLPLDSASMSDVPEGSLSNLASEELADLNEEQLAQMMMEDEEYGRRQLELAAIEIAKNKKKEEREAKKLEKARQKALEILAAEQQRDPNAMESGDGEAPKKKKRGRRSKAEILAEQMRRGADPTLAVLPPSMSVTSPGMVPPLVGNPIMTGIPPPGMLPADIDRPDVAMMAGHLITGPDGQLFNPDGSPIKPKRRGRGKGKKTLAMEAARAAEAAAKAAGIGSDCDLKPDDMPNVLPTPGSSTSGSAPSTPPAISVTQGVVMPVTQASNPVYPQLPSQQSSVITRMLQSQPISSATPQSFTAAAAAMGQKYFGVAGAGSPMMAGPRGAYDLQPRGRIPSPYNSRQPGGPLPPHFAAVRSGTPPMRMRVPGPTQLYHTPHHPMDPSPSGGGPIAITSRDRSSPLAPGPAMIPPAAGSPLAKGGPTPPPPPYVRGSPLARFAENAQLAARHAIPPFTSASANHVIQQPSPPPNRPGNFSPYHPQPPPNYHYGAYPPPPPMTTADDAAAYQGGVSPYSSEHFSAQPDSQPTSAPPATIQAPPPPPAQTSQQQPQTTQPPPTLPTPHPAHPPAAPEGAPAPGKQYDEEGTGEFGGLVSYFSSQREDDLDS